jgi:hypothetical protein
MSGERREHKDIKRLQLRRKKERRMPESRPRFLLKGIVSLFKADFLRLWRINPYRPSWAPAGH